MSLTFVLTIVRKLSRRLVIHIFVLRFTSLDYTLHRLFWKNIFTVQVYFCVKNNWITEYLQLQFFYDSTQIWIPFSRLQLKPTDLIDTNSIGPSNSRTVWFVLKPLRFLETRFFLKTTRKSRRPNKIINNYLQKNLTHFYLYLLLIIE